MEVSVASPDCEQKSNFSADLGNLAAFDVRKTPGLGKPLLEFTTENVQQLVNKIFECPTTPNVDGPGRLAELPAPTTKFPREKPVPVAKPLTRWQQFAQRKGIQKKKKDKIEYDEASGEWRRRHGYKRANDEQEQWVIEHKEGTDPSVDPFMKMQNDKKKRIRENRENQQKNLASAPGQRVPGTLDLSATVRSAGKAQPRNQKPNRGTKRNAHLDTTLKVAQMSTASMGIHDTLNKDETKPKGPKRQKRDRVQFQRDIAVEKKSSLSILDQIVGTKPKGKDAFDVSKVVNRINPPSKSKSKPSNFKKSKKMSKSGKKPKRTKRQKHQ
eukprot:129447_1